MSQVNTELYNKYKSLAKQADKRLERLENLAKKPQRDKQGKFTTNIYRGVKGYAYKVAEHAINKNWGGSKKGQKPRFFRKTPKTEEELKQKIKDIEHFLSLITSTKKGIDTTYKKRADSLNATFVTNFTWQEWARFGVRGFWEQTEGRATYNELIAVAKEQKKNENLYKETSAILKGKNVKSKIKPKAVKKLEKEARGAISEIDEITGGLLSEDYNLIQKTKNTIFEEDEGIVLKQAKQFMQEKNIDYKKMFT